MKRTIFLQDENALWLKGNLHSHTVFSDGHLTPEEMKAAYKHHGYDFLAVTDHNVYTDTRHMTEDTFTMIQGFELSGKNDPGNRNIHVHFLWDDSLTEFTHGQDMNLPQANAQATQDFSYAMRDKGAFVMLNHPHWSMLTSPEVKDENPYHAVEIMNYATEWLENTGDGSVFWSELLLRGLRLWGGGSDDNHNEFPLDSLYCDSFGGFTVVKARDRSPKAILEALKTGSYYTSTGPAIYDFYVEGDEVHVMTSPCERIYVCGEQYAAQSKLGRHVTEFVTKLKGYEHVVRCEAMDAAGRSAYSNPIFLD